MDHVSKHVLFQSIDERIHRDKQDGDQAFLNALLLKFEFLTKIVVASIVSFIGNDADRNRYSIEYKLLRANSLGSWITALDSATVGPASQHLIFEARNIVRDLTENVGQGDWRYIAVDHLHHAAKQLDVEPSTPLGQKVALRELFRLGVQIRNRTRGHGATTLSQCSNACRDFEQSLKLVIENMRMFNLEWVYLHQNQSGKYRVSPLVNGTSTFNHLKSSTAYNYENGVYIALLDNGRSIENVRVALLFTDAEVSDIFLPNGNFVGERFDSLSYVTNFSDSQDGAPWLDPPTRLPESETEGQNALEILGNAFSNSPSVRSDYVPRLEPEDRLCSELSKSDHHPIITLTGPGGIGKTSIALAAIHEISKPNPPVFDVILWISARDIDLLEVGAKPVAQRVFAENDIAEAAVDLIDPSEKSENNFNAKEYFQNYICKNKKEKTLVVLDNFETLQNPGSVFRWIDTYVRLPNKVLVTTRFRDFEGDFPIEISGMSAEEANTLIERQAGRLGIGGLLTEAYKQTLISESEGHPYAIKILLAEVGKSKRPRAPKRVFGTKDQILNALFKRTYMRLSPASQRIFLLLCSWRDHVPEVAVQAVVLRPQIEERIDVISALDDLSRFSLIESFDSEQDNERFVYATLAATIFGQNELVVSPWKTMVEEDRRLLMEFGGSGRNKSSQTTYPRIEKFFDFVVSQVNDRLEELDELKPILEYVANQHPRAYCLLEELNSRFCESEDSLDQSIGYIQEYLKKESSPQEKTAAWQKLATLYERKGDAIGEINSLCQACYLQSSDHERLGTLANTINYRIREIRGPSDEFAKWENIQSLLKPVIEIIRKHLPKLSATNCSRLAWLHLNTGDRTLAHQVSKIGHKRDPKNEHVIRLLERLETDQT